MGSGLASCISDDTNCAVLKNNMQLWKPVPALTERAL